MRILAVIGLLAMISPSSAFLAPQEYNVSVRIVLVKSLDDVRVRCALAGGDPLKVHGWVGCARLNKSQCHVIALPPLAWHDSDRIHVLGHEMLHCIGLKHP